MIQMRKDGGDGRWHSPDRDLAYCFPSLTRAALDQLSVTNWKPWFQDYFKFAGVTEADIGRAAEAFARFLRHVCDSDVATPRDALIKAGWFDLPNGVQVALFMKLGQVCTMAFFSAIRDVTPENEAPPLDAQGLYESAMRANFELTRQWGPRKWARRQWAYLRSYVWPFRSGGKRA